MPENEVQEEQEPVARRARDLEEDLEAEWAEAKKRRDERRRAERELRPYTERLEMLHDPNSSALSDPAVSTVVTKHSLLRDNSIAASSIQPSCSTSGLIRASRTTLKCPHCIRTFSDNLRLNAHIENQH